MRVLFVGASGKVGVELVPLMAMHFETVVLAGRDPKKMAHLFPCFRCVSDQSIAEEARGFDALIHMSAMNNDRDDTPLDDYVAVNVNYLTFIAKQAAQAGVGMFINFSTAHVLRENVSHYSTSKKMGEDALAKVADLKVINLRIPAIYGKVLSGNLARLNKVPAPLR